MHHDRVPPKDTEASPSKNLSVATVKFYWRYNIFPQQDYVHRQPGSPLLRPAVMSRRYTGSVTYGEIGRCGLVIPHRDVSGPQAVVPFRVFQRIWRLAVRMAQCHERSVPPHSTGAG